MFDRLDLVVDFRAGRNGIGATMKSFIDAIKAHDGMVLRLEASMLALATLKKGYKTKNRLFRNLDSAWNVILENPIDYYDYLELLPKMDNIVEKLKLIIDPVDKEELHAQYVRFKALEPICSKQLAIYSAYLEAREGNDEAIRQLLAAEKELAKQVEEEKLLAAQISDDHVMADELKKPLSVVFPNVQGDRYHMMQNVPKAVVKHELIFNFSICLVGYILATINGEYVEDLPFAEVMSRVRRARSPHNAVFLRYDYRYDPFKGDWRSLQELREMGVCVEDPLLQKMHFISLAAQGDLSSVQHLLLSGEDPNATDLTGSTALAAAAVNQHEEVIKLLFKAGADVNLPDKNVVTLSLPRRCYLTSPHHL